VKPCIKMNFKPTAFNSAKCRDCSAGFTLGRVKGFFIV